jgi:hypothetical protein
MHRQVPEFQPKSKLFARDLQSLSDAARSSRILPGYGIRVTTSPQGTVVALARRNNGASFDEDTHPFEPYRAPYYGQGEPPASQRRTIRIRRGFINDVLPQNIDNTFVVPSGRGGPEPGSTGAPGGQPQLFYVEANLSATTNSVKVTSATVKQADELPQQNNSDDVPSKAYLPIFYIYTNSEVITSVSKLQKTNANGLLVVTNWDCKNIWREWMWSHPTQTQWNDW